MTAKAWYIPISYSQRYMYSKGVEVSKANIGAGTFDAPYWKPKG